MQEENAPGSGPLGQEIRDDARPHGYAGEHGLFRHTSEGPPGALEHRRPADPVDQHEPLVERRGPLAAEEVGRDDLMSGATQSLGSEEFDGAQAQN